MKTPFVAIETEKVSWCSVPCHVEYSPRPHHVSGGYALEAQTLSLSHTALQCTVVSVPPLSLRSPRLQSAGEGLKDVHVASVIEIEIMGGKTMKVPVLCAKATKRTANKCEYDEQREHLFVELSSVCTHNNVLLRDLNTGELLVPQPHTFYCQSSHEGEAWRMQQRKIVVLNGLEGRYQLVAITLKTES